ncbi:MAG: DUF3472 domain-containing protein [Rubripirellula sp.]
MWIAEKGELEVLVEIQDVNGQWTLRLDDQSRSLDRKAKRVSFGVKEAGKHTIAISRSSDKANGKIIQLSLAGAAAKNARVLRARWRPAAVHTQYHCSDCPQTRMWVFESRSMADASSYSPMTTQFGYYGGSFDADRTAHGNLNFSMWAANSKAKAAPPLESMPRLTGTGNAMAEFSGFGHEGSGVKIRNWEPIANHATSIILALRVETHGTLDTFTGYFLDEKVNRWVMYARANKPSKKTRKKTPDEPTYLRPASFCEVPGPPAVQRMGDVRRIIHRRGWFYGKDSKWHAVDRQTTKSDRPTNKYITTKNGWFVMSTGGMEMIQSKPSVSLPVSVERPEYLSAEMTKQLFQHPVEFGKSSTSRVTTRSAVVNYQLKDAGTNAKAVLYYGPKDCLTFIQRALHGTESKGVSKAMLASERTWSSQTESKPVHTGFNRLPLQGLEPKTKYFYRLLVQNNEGKCWDSQSGSFTTR